MRLYVFSEVRVISGGLVYFWTRSGENNGLGSVKPNEEFLASVDRRIFWPRIGSGASSVRACFSRRSFEGETSLFFDLFSLGRLPVTQGVCVSEEFVFWACSIIHIKPRCDPASST